MQCVRVFFLPAVFVHAYSNELAGNPKNCLDSIVEHLAGKLFDRMPTTSLIQHDDLDGTTLAKPVKLAMPASSFSSSSFQFGDVRGLSERGQPQQFAEDMRSKALGVATRVVEPSSRRVALAGALWTAFGLSSTGPALAKPIPQIQDVRKELTSKIYAFIQDKLLSGTVDISIVDALRIVFHEAATYDRETRTAGFSGSIRFELDRPENAGLAPAVRQLETLQKELQEATGKQITFADTEAFVLQLVVSKNFYDRFCGVTEWKTPCDVAYAGYGNKPGKLKLGRKDSSGPDPEGRVPWVGSSLADIKAVGKKLNLTPQQTVALAPVLIDDEAKAIELFMQDKQYAEFLRQEKSSKESLTRAAYEVSVFEAFEKLVDCGARFEKYPYDIPP